MSSLRLFRRVLETTAKKRAEKRTIRLRKLLIRRKTMTFRWTRRHPRKSLTPLPRRSSRKHRLKRLPSRILRPSRRQVKSRTLRPSRILKKNRVPLTKTSIGSTVGSRLDPIFTIFGLKSGRISQKFKKIVFMPVDLTDSQVFFNYCFDKSTHGVKLHNIVQIFCAKGTK